MRAYRVDDGTKLHFSRTFREAHNQSKAWKDQLSGYTDIRIQLVSFSADQEAIIGALNGDPAFVFKLLRMWRLTPRGGPIEIPTEKLIGEM